MESRLLFLCLRYIGKGFVATSVMILLLLKIPWRIELWISSVLSQDLVYPSLPPHTHPNSTYLFSITHYSIEPQQTNSLKNYKQPTLADFLITFVVTWVTLRPIFFTVKHLINALHVQITYWSNIQITDKNLCWRYSMIHLLFMR